MQLTNTLFKLIRYHIFSPVLGIILGEWAVYLEDAARVIDETDSDEESGPEE